MAYSLARYSKSLVQQLRSKAHQTSSIPRRVAAMAVSNSAKPVVRGGFVVRLQAVCLEMVYLQPIYIIGAWSS